jgi:hypothetical protein
LAVRTPAEAVRTFVGAFQSVVSCLTVARFSAEGYRPIDLPYSAELQDGEAVVIAGPPLRLLIVLRYRIVQAANSPGAWVVQLTAYDYELLDNSDREILAYQWHPQARSPVTWPHVHLGPAAGELWRPLGRAHLPTGRIAVQDVLRLAIRDFGVPPRRANWEAVLDRTQRALEA